MDKIKADPLALNAVICAVLKGPNTTPDDFKRATLVDSFSMIYQKFPDWAEPTPGDFSILGLLENMHTLHFPNKPGRSPIQVDDFSFLARCKRLKRLDVARTNFSDCSILLQLPFMNYVHLPPREQLIHLEVLDKLPWRRRVDFLPPPPAPVLPKPRPEPSETARAIVEEIKRRTAADCYTLDFQPGSQPGLFDSKFGGFPYWDPALPYPVDSAGEKLVLLAQINFDQFPADDPLPRGGMLQFFAGQDECFGMEFSGGRTDGYRVVYHENINPSITEEQLKSLDIPTHADVEYWPVIQSGAVTLEKTTDYICPEDFRFPELFARAFHAVTGEPAGSGADNLREEVEDYFYDQLWATGSHLLGWPHFTQADPREEDGRYGTVLFQMASDWEEEETYVMWGDAGVGNFFIDLEKLKQRDFSDVLYNWDCY